MSRVPLRRKPAYRVDGQIDWTLFGAAELIPVADLQRGDLAIITVPAWQTGESGDQPVEVWREVIHVYDLPGGIRGGIVRNGRFEQRSVKFRSTVIAAHRA